MSCKHENCMNVPRQDILYSRNALYATTIKKDWDTKISHLLSVQRPKRNLRNIQNVRIKYILWNEGQTASYKVCQKFFLAALHVSQRRVITIAKNLINDCGVVEKRGGDHRSHRFNEKRTTVTEFIGKLKGTEAHYNRNKSKRIYLSSALNISKLYQMYNNQADDDLKVKKSFFSKYSSTNLTLVLDLLL